MVLISMVAAFSLMLGLSACGDNTEQLNSAAYMVTEHYKSHPPSRGWSVLSVRPVVKEDKVLVQILVSETGDINKIKSLRVGRIKENGR